MNVHEQADDIVAKAARPWMSAVWGRSGEKVAAELRALPEDPRFGDAIHDCAAKTRSGSTTELGDAVEVLLGIATEKAPTALHCMGREGLMVPIDVFVHDRVANTTELVSVSTSGSSSQPLSARAPAVLWSGGRARAEKRTCGDTLA